MFNHGARHIYLTSRRGRKALSPLDTLYLRDINNKGGDAQAISCDALSKTDTAKLIETAESVGKDEGGDSPANLLSGLLGLGVDQISDNALITSYGLDSLAGTPRGFRFWSI